MSSWGGTGPLTKFIRDVCPVAVGAWILVHEELTGVVHVELLLVAGTAIGIPGLGALFSLFLGREKAPAISGESSPSPEQVSH